MAKVLLVDTNFSSVPIYRELLEMGNEVHVVGGNPLDCLAKQSPNYHHIDYSDTKALEKHIIAQKYDYLVPGCTDRSYESCVKVNRGKFPGFDNAAANRAVNNKALFREIAVKLGLPIPQTQDPDLKTLRWPLIVKPVDAYSGKGMTIIEAEDSNKLQEAIKTACQTSPGGDYLIEDFVEGQLHSHSAFLKKGKVLQDFIVREDGTVNPFVVDTSRVLQNPDVKLLKSLRMCVEALANKLQLQDGLLHTQFIKNGNSFWLIELTRRCPGDLYSQLIQMTTDYHYVRAYILPFLGMPLESTNKPIKNHPTMRHTMTLKTGQNLGFIRFKQAIRIERWIPLSLVGDQLKPSPISRIGILFCQATNQQELDSIYQSALRRELYEVKT